MSLTCLCIDIYYKSTDSLRYYRWVLERDLMKLKRDFKDLNLSFSEISRKVNCSRKAVT